jgi:hypothetical protein
VNAEHDGVQDVDDCRDDLLTAKLLSYMTTGIIKENHED